MTYARSYPDIIAPWAEANDVPLLSNALHRYSDAQERLLHMWTYDCPHAIDAGGYNVQSTFVTRDGELDADITGDDIVKELCTPSPFYPWTVEDYHQWLADYDDEVTWASAMDYACSELFDGLWSSDDRIETTFQNTLRQYERLEDSSADYQLLPVLQGTTPDEHVAFYERLEDHGLPTDHVGLGSITGISNDPEIVDYEQAVRSRIDPEIIHGFGVKIEAFQYGSEFESADTQAWLYPAMNEYVSVDIGNRLARFNIPGNLKARKVESFKSYYSYVTRLQQGESAVDYESPAVNASSDKEAQQIFADIYS
jgi:hypothetical protein